MAVDHNSTTSAATSKAPRKVRRAGNVCTIGTRKEDVRPLLGEVLAICERINDADLDRIEPHAWAVVSAHYRRKEDMRVGLRRIAAMCAVVDDEGLEEIKSYALHIAKLYPRNPDQQPTRQTAEVIRLADWRAKRRALDKHA